jgi:5S rRNA maturation endonuclease (ribonuclease M5)
VKWLEGLDTKEAAQRLRDFLGDYVPATYRAGVIPSNRVTPQEAHRLQVVEDTSRRLEGDTAKGLMKRYLASRGWPESVEQEFALEVVLDKGGAPRVRHSFLSPDSLGGWLVTHYQDRAINALKEGDAKWLGSSTPKTLYNLPALEREGVRAVVICEGCPDTITAHIALQGSDVAAIGCAGVNSWRKEYAQVLDGKGVVIAADNDEAGKKLEEAILSSTRSKVRLFRPAHNDLTDTAKALGLDVVREALLLTAMEVK